MRLHTKLESVGVVHKVTYNKYPDQVKHSIKEILDIAMKCVCY